MRTSLLRLSAVLLAGLLAGVAPARAAGEYELKAAFLYNFAVFTEWPAPPAEVKVCIIGHDPFGSSIFPLNKKTVRGSTVRVRHIASASEARGCQLLFIAASEHGNVSQITGHLRDEPVLTVAEANGYDHREVAIVLVSSNNRIGFEINQRTAQQAGLKLSSQLLKLARQVQ